MAVSNEQLMALLAAMNPDMAPLLSLLTAMEAPQEAAKPKRKASPYNKAYSRNYRSIKAKHTLKNGKMAKGWGGKKGHMRILEAAHKETKKELKK